MPSSPEQLRSEAFPRCKYCRSDECRAALTEKPEEDCETWKEEHTLPPCVCGHRFDAHTALVWTGHGEARETGCEKCQCREFTADERVAHYGADQ